MSVILNSPPLLCNAQAPVKYSLSDSEDEFDDWEKKSSPKRKAVISDDDTSFAPEPSAVTDSDVNSPAPPPKAAEPMYVGENG